MEHRNEESPPLWVGFRLNRDHGFGGTGGTGGTGGVGGTGGTGSTLSLNFDPSGFFASSLPASALATATHAALRSVALLMLAMVSFFSLSVGKRPSVASVMASSISASLFFAAISSPTSFSRRSTCGACGAGGVGGTGGFGGTTGGFGCTFGVYWNSYVLPGTTGE